MVSSGALLKTGSVYLALFKLNPKSQTIYRGRKRVCVFVGGYGGRWRGKEPMSQFLKENILLPPLATKQKKLMCPES